MITGLLIGLVIGLSLGAMLGVLGIGIMQSAKRGDQALGNEAPRQRRERVVMRRRWVYPPPGTGR